MDSTKIKEFYAQHPDSPKNNVYIASLLAVAETPYGDNPPYAHTANFYIAPDLNTAISDGV